VKHSCYRIRRFVWGGKSRDFQARSDNFVTDCATFCHQFFSKVIYKIRF